MMKIKKVFGFKHGSLNDSGGCSGSFGFRSPRIPETLIPESNGNGSVVLTNMRHKKRHSL